MAMKTMSPANSVLIALLSAFVCLPCGRIAMAQDSDGLNRLLHKALQIPVTVQDTSNCSNSGNCMEAVHASAKGDARSPGVRPATYVPTVRYAQQPDAPAAGQDADFRTRDRQTLDPRNFVPEPVTRTVRDVARDHRQQDPSQDSRGEYIYDGNDRGKRIVVDEQWNVYGLDTEDTIGHFDTLDGRRMVSPSNRVAIYAPRFGAVRKVSGLSNSIITTGPISAERRTQIVQSDGQDFSATAKQHLEPVGYAGRAKASAFNDRTRGVTADSITRLYGARNLFKPYENLQLIRIGRYSSAEGARLKIGMMSANVWRDDLGLQVQVANVQPVIVNDVYRVQAIETIDTDGDNAVLRVTKVASRMYGKPGDEIEFTIRYDNLSRQKVGNVTIIDNLTSRLEYVPGSAQSSLHADFITEANEKGSLVLRWEIRDPVPAGEGGIVRFKCIVR